MVETNAGVMSWKSEDLFDISFYEGDGKNLFVADVLRKDSSVGESSRTRDKDGGGRLGWLVGVYLPTLQNILGVILFLRLTYITAQAGTFLTTLIVVLCVTSTTLTALSMSAIATNGKISAGGPYFVISRNLGQEIGGAVGTMFYLGITSDSAMYALGCAEAIKSAFNATTEPFFYFDSQVISLALMTLSAFIVYNGVTYVNRSANAILAIVLFSIFLLLLSVILFMSKAWTGDLTASDFVPFDNLRPVYVNDPITGQSVTFFTLMALFYPGVTGIMAGSNRSGVLADPGHAIPKGTLGAIATTAILYILVVWLYGSSVSNEVLINDKLVVTTLAWPHKLVVNVGIIMSSMGACMQSLTGAPRLLAAIAADGYIPFIRFFASKDEPKRAVILTYILASLPCLSGNLDYINTYITMCFLMMYATVNASCCSLAFLRSPGFRPRWRYFNKWTALLGFVWCITLMVVISWYVALITMFLAILIMLYIRAQGAAEDWGDAIMGLKMQLANDLLFSLGVIRPHPKNFRPQILLFTELDDDANPVHQELIALAGQMKKGRGLLTVCSLIVGERLEDIRRTEELKQELNSYLKARGVKAFVKVNTCADVHEGMFLALQSSGIGVFEPNTVFLSWMSHWQKAKSYEIDDYVHILKASIESGKSLLVLKGGDKLPFLHFQLAPKTTIDVWWVTYDGGLLLLIPHLLSLHKSWRSGKIRIFSVVTEPNVDAQEMEVKIRRHLMRVRINAEVRAIDVSALGNLDSFYHHTVDMNMRAKFLATMNNPATLSTEVHPQPRHRSVKDFFEEEEQQIRSMRKEEPFRKDVDEQRHVGRSEEQDGECINDKESVREDHRNEEIRRGRDVPATPTSSSSKISLGLSSSPKENNASFTSKFNAFMKAFPFGATKDHEEKTADATHDIENQPENGSEAVQESKADTIKPEESTKSNDSFPPREKRALSRRERQEEMEIIDQMEIARRSLSFSVKTDFLRAAVVMNRAMLHWSRDSTLVVTNLPLSSHSKPKDFMAYVDILCGDLSSVLLIRGTGEEVITTYG